MKKICNIFLWFILVFSLFLTFILFSTSCGSKKQDTSSSNLIVSNDLHQIGDQTTISFEKNINSKTPTVWQYDKTLSFIKEISNDNETITFELICLVDNTSFIVEAINGTTSVSTTVAVTIFENYDAVVPVKYFTIKDGTIIKIDHAAVDVANYDTIYFPAIIQGQYAYAIKERVFSNLQYIKNIIFAVNSKMEGIWDFNFINLPLLESITFANSLITIKHSFNECPNIKNVLFPTSLIDISKNSFVDVDNNFKNKYYLFDVIDDGFIQYLQLINDMYICYGFSIEPSTIVEHLTIRENTISFYDQAFENSLLLNEVILPDSVINISNGCFANSSLENINCPNQLVEIERFAFNNSKISSFNFANAASTLLYLREAAFSKCLFLYNVDLSSLSIEYLDDYLFSETNLHTIILPANIIGIRQYCFYGCNYLVSFSGPSTLRYVDKYALSNCNLLTNIDFRNCENLELTNPSFYNNPNLTYFYVHDKLEYISLSIFNDTNNLFLNTNANRNTFYNLTTDSIKIYYLKKQNNQLICLGIKNDDVTTDTTITLLNQTTIIGIKAFINQVNLIDVNISTSVYNIQSYAFYNCSALTNIDLSAITNFGQFAISKTNISQYTMSNELKYIDQYAFADNNNLTSLKFSDNLVNLSINVFLNCGLTSYDKIDLANNSYYGWATNVGTGSHILVLKTNNAFIVNKDFNNFISNFAYGNLVINDNFTSIEGNDNFLCYIDSVSISKRIYDVNGKTFASNPNLVTDGVAYSNSGANYNKWALACYDVASSSTVTIANNTYGIANWFSWPSNDYAFSYSCVFSINADIQYISVNALNPIILSTAIINSPLISSFDASRYVVCANTDALEAIGQIIYDNTNYYNHNYLVGSSYQNYVPYISYVGNDGYPSMNWYIQLDLKINFTPATSSHYFWKSHPNLPIKYLSSYFNQENILATTYNYYG